MTPGSVARLLWLGLLLSFVPPLGAQSVPERAGSNAVLPLSLEEAIARAAAGNPGLQIARNDQTPALWEERSARASLLPSLSTNFGVAWEGSGEQRVGSFTGGELGFGERPSFYFSSYGVGLNYSLSGSTLLAPREASANLRAQRARLRTSEADLALEVTRRYLDILRAGEAVRLARQELARAEANLRLAAGQVAVGAATPLDERQAQLAVGRAQVNLLREEGEGRNAALLLFLVMGEEPDGRELVLTTEFALEPFLPSEAELYRIGLEANPALSALRAQETAAEYSVRSARTAYYPTLSLQAGWQGFTRQASNSDFLVGQSRRQLEQAEAQCQLQNQIFSRLTDPLPTADCSQFAFTDGDRDAIIRQNQAFPFDFTRQPPSLQLTLSLPIFQGLQRQRQLEGARVIRDNNSLRVREQELTLRTEIARGLTAVETAFRAAELEAENREVAADQLRLAREQYEIGSVDFLQLAEAEAVLARAEREYVAAIFAYHESTAVLEAVVGTSLRER